MASTSTSTQVVLPSIHEMFPEHLIPRSDPYPRAGPAPMTPGAFPRSHYVPPPPPPHHSFSFDVLKSDPRGASLTHIASSRPPPQRVRTEPLQLPRQAPSSSGSSDGDGDMDVDVDDGEDDGDGTGEGKKHVCPTCAKRFNRPSSLRIHVNTHTGATPFRCPHPGCGRAFNVNSNMRRHFRNHASPAFASTSPTISSTSPTSATSSSSFNSLLSAQSQAFLNSPLSPASSASPPWSALSSPVTPLSASGSPFSYRDAPKYAPYPLPAGYASSSPPHERRNSPPRERRSSPPRRKSPQVEIPSRIRAPDGRPSGHRWPPLAPATWPPSMSAYSESDVRSERR
ncbi:hypothetical protein C8R43DRAFT_1017467 [Mycena crocata]|nr:hypothetical protein C8R43DRAFT_1017467 [Mycena crocata]